MQFPPLISFFFFNDTATPEIYTLSLHDALPISPTVIRYTPGLPIMDNVRLNGSASAQLSRTLTMIGRPDRKSTRLNSSHLGISYAVFCLKKKKNCHHQTFLAYPSQPHTRLASPQ